MAGTPKRKHSTARQGKRRSQIKFLFPKFLTCKNCGSPKLPHVSCKNCHQ